MRAWVGVLRAEIGAFVCDAPGDCFRALGLARCAAVQGGAGWLAGWLAGNRLFIQKQRRGY